MSLCCVSLYSNRNVLEPRGGRTVSANVSEQTDHWGCRLDAQSFSREFFTCSAFFLKVVLRVEATDETFVVVVVVNKRQPVPGFKPAAVRCPYMDSWTL